MRLSFVVCGEIQKILDLLENNFLFYFDYHSKLFKCEYKKSMEKSPGFPFVIDTLHTKKYMVHLQTNVNN